jgi:hypothetical protein
MMKVLEDVLRILDKAVRIGKESRKDTAEPSQRSEILVNKKLAHLACPFDLPDDDIEPFYLERHHPLHRGLMKFRFELSTNEIGLDIFMDRYRYSGQRDTLTLSTVESLLNSLPSVPTLMQLMLNIEAPQTISQDSLFCSTTSISSRNASSQTLTPLNFFRH